MMQIGDEPQSYPSSRDVAVFYVVVRGWSRCYHSSAIHLRLSRAHHKSRSILPTKVLDRLWDANKSGRSRVPVETEGLPHPVDLRARADVKKSWILS